MPAAITIHRADVVSLIEEAAAKLTGGNKTEAVALAMRHLLDKRRALSSARIPDQ